MIGWYLILEKGSTEGPDAAEDEVELIPLLRTVRWRVFGSQDALEQVAEHLQVADVTDRCDLLEFQSETHRDVLVEEDCQVGSLGLHTASIDPTAHVSARTKRKAF